MKATYPFSRPVRRVRPAGDGPRRAFLVGAYPSAVHVRWTPPPDLPWARTVQALPVADEPYPFWDGADEHSRIVAWRRAVRFDAERYGEVTGAGSLNGSSGRWVDEHVLGPLRLDRDQVWATDCLTTYRSSAAVAAAVEAVYEPIARRLGLPPAHLVRHPSEQQIVGEACERERDRLRAELASAQPQIVVTLGNAALRVLRTIADEAEGGPRRGLSLSGYGELGELRLGDRSMLWLPIAHPGAPPQYQEAQRRWTERI